MNKGTAKLGRTMVPQPHGRCDGYYIWQVIPSRGARIGGEFGRFLHPLLVLAATLGDSARFTAR